MAHGKITTFRVEKEEDEVFKDEKDLKESRRPVYIYLLLLSGYILYLTLGGIRAPWATDRPLPFTKSLNGERVPEKHLFSLG